MLRVVLTVAAILALIVLVGAFGCSSLERKFLFYPTHDSSDGGLTAWKDSAGTTIGFARLAPAPQNVWLMLHGNAGQAADRSYALPSFATNDSVYILEYPGYGLRAGLPSQRTFDAAARDAYELLCATYPNTPVCVVGESIGTGPACVLANAPRPPAKIVLVTPFARLADVARNHFPGWMVAALLKSDWNNIDALARYAGPVEIFGAERDSIIPVAHARALAAAKAGAVFTLIPGEHNEWSTPGRVTIRHGRAP